MDVLIVMCVGVLVGNPIFPRKAKGINEKVQLHLHAAADFFHGGHVGRAPHFLSELAAWGLTAYSIV